MSDPTAPDRILWKRTKKVPRRGEQFPLGLNDVRILMSEIHDLLGARLKTMQLIELCKYSLLFLDPKLMVGQALSNIPQQNQ